MYGCKLQQRVGASALWAPHLISLHATPACWRLGNSMKEAAEGPEGRDVGPKMGSYSYSAFGQAQGVDPAVRRSVNRRIEG